MRLWNWASGVLKDNNSLFLTSLTRRSALRNPDIEAAVIRATSHDESCVDYRHTQCVFAWIRMSDIYLRPVLWAISNRLKRTQSWVVALKGLVLLHGVFCCKVPAVQKIGGLPFDLSAFKDRYSGHRRTWSYEAFVRAYYAFLDRKSTFALANSEKRMEGTMRGGALPAPKGKPVTRDLDFLQQLQGLLDVALRIRPESEATKNILVLEAMDCVVIEIFDIYSRICNGIAYVLVRIYSMGKTEAEMALSVLEKARVQSEELSRYFDFCRDIGVVNASECPKIEQIPKDDIRDLKHVIEGFSDESIPGEVEKAVIVEEQKKPTGTHERNESTGSLKTVVTDDWEVFEEKPMKPNTNPFVEDKIDGLPDLISL